MKIAIIPARGGSKRIPRKNIKEFCGKPMIAHSILAAIECGLFDKVMVSTDDQEIANIAVEFGAEVPFFRSTSNSDDYSGTGDVMFEVISEFEKLGEKFDAACCIYATSPLITKNRLQESFELFDSGIFDVVFPVGRFSSPIFRSYKSDGKNKAVMNFPEYEAKRSQDLPETYFDAGQYYWVYPDNLKSLPNKNSFGVQKGMIILEEYEVQDIDLPSDWEIAELKYKFMKEKISSGINL